jgi:hypothetical protein
MMLDSCNFMTEQYFDPLLPFEIRSLLVALTLGQAWGYYDGVALWTTPFGAFSIANGVIVGDVSRRSSTYEARITKYMRSKGMSLVLCNTTGFRLCQYVQTQLPAGLSADCVSFQVVRYLAVRQLDIDKVVTVVQPPTKLQQLSDYTLNAQEFRLGDLEKYNARAALKGQLHLLTWKYDFSNNDLGRKVLHCAAPDFKNTVVPNAERTHFVVPVSGG